MSAYENPVREFHCLKVADSTSSSTSTKYPKYSVVATGKPPFRTTGADVSGQHNIEPASRLRGMRRIVRAAKWRGTCPSKRNIFPAISAGTQSAGQFIKGTRILKSRCKCLGAPAKPAPITSAAFLDRLTQCIRSLPVRCHAWTSILGCAVSAEPENEEIRDFQPGDLEATSRSK